MNKAIWFVGLITMLAVCLALRAQTGCDDSPEDPTIVLALVAALGALTFGVRGTLSRKKR